MELIQDELSLRIIESAKKIAKEKGIGKITVRDILKDLELTNRVFYNRFHNINEVLEVIYNDAISKVRESLAISWDECSDFWQHIQMVAERTLIFSYESRSNMSAYIFELDSVANDNFNWWQQEIRKLILLGKKHHHISENLDEIAISYSIWCFIRGFNADAIARHLPREDALAQFRYGFSCFMNGIKGEK